MTRNPPIIQLVGLTVPMVFIAACLPGCTSAPVRLTCPPLVQYGPQEQAMLASELRAHPELREVPVFLTDYGNERAECKALDTKKTGG